MLNTPNHDPDDAAKQNDTGSIDTGHDQRRGYTAESQCIPKGANDFVTIAQAADGKLMTKIFFVDSEGRAQTRNFDKGYLFYFHTRPVTCLRDLALVLDGLDQHSCVIHGKLIDGTKTPCRRLLLPDAETGKPATIEGAAHFWLLLDIDKLPIEGELFDAVAEPERAAAYIRGRLPSEFHKAQCLWRLTSSAGIKKGPTISMRLGFWLDRALTGAEVKAWLKGTIVDCAIYTPNQVIYAAAPVFKNGRTDPVPRRSGILEDEENTVTPGEPPLPVARVSKPVVPFATPVRRQAPKGVVFDTEAAIERGRELIERALTSDEWERSLRDLPSPTGARAYKLTASLKDEALSPEKIVELLIEMVPWFVEKNRREITAMVDSVFRHGQNEPGCGNPNSIAHLFTEVVDEWEAEARDRQALWEKIAESSQGAIQPLPVASAPSDFSLAFTESVRRTIAADRAELARRLG